MGELGRQGLGHHLLPSQLILGRIEPDLQPVGLDLGRLEWNLGALQRGDEGLVQRLADLLDARTRYLDDRILREKVWQGIKQADQQHDGHQKVLPQGILIKHDSREASWERPHRTVAAGAVTSLSGCPWA